MWQCCEVTVPKHFISRTCWLWFVLSMLVCKACPDETNVCIVNFVLSRTV
jgi:hypothetical protein